MDVQIETPGGLVRQLRIRIPAERVSSALSERLKRIAAQARIPGFRPGKAPFKVIEQQYGEAARMDVIQDLVRVSYPEAVGQAGVNPASAPRFEVLAEKPGEALEYLARFEVYPEIRLQPFSELKVERPDVEVTAADVDKMVQSLRNNRRTFTVVERAAREGDTCQLGFEGYLDGQPFEGGKSEKTEIEIGRHQFLPELEQGLIGHAAGEQFEVEVNFPADYRAEHLRGKKAVFKVDLREVREPVLPEIDAEFLKAHGVDEAAGIEGLHTKVRGALEAERDKAARSRLKQQIMDQLLAAHPIEVPRAMIAEEMGRLREETAARLNAGQLKPDQKQQLFPDEMLEAPARRRVSLGLLVAEVIRSKKIEADPARIERQLDEMAADYQQPEQVRQYYRSRPELMQGLRAIVLEDQVVEALLSEAKSSDVKMGLDELLSPKAQNQ
jgi:trigger factor